MLPPLESFEREKGQYAPDQILSIVNMRVLISPVID